MDISKITSVELDASKPFYHYIKFRDETGYVVDQMKVPDSKSMEMFQDIYKKWASHEDFMKGYK